MAIDFPASPTLNQTFTSGNVNYVWDGTKWTAAVSGGIALDQITEGNTKAEVIDTGSDGRFVVTTEGSERLRVDSSGRLGIGTTVASSFNADLSKLVVGGGSGNEGILVYSGTASTGNIAFHDTADTSLSGMIRYDHSSNAMSFWTNGVNERFRCDSSGRLLVGTTSSNNDNIAGTGYPNLIQIVGGTTGAGLAVRNTADVSRINIIRSANSLASGTEIGSLSFGAETTTSIERARISAFTDSSGINLGRGGQLRFYTCPDGEAIPTERMRISANGETTFYSSVNTLLGLRIGEASGWGGNPAIHTSSNVGYIIIRNGTSGGVGLSGGGTSWSSLSDENYKTDLTPITDAATKVRSLRTVTGRYTDDNEATSRSFLIAQDVEAVLPEAVSTADSGQKLLSYTDTIPLLTAALKEALEKIETLEAKVAALESA